jgi:DNA-binding winged helix-turn-helix (wHTH) protein/TolB-like protein
MSDADGADIPREPIPARYVRLSGPPAARRPPSPSRVLRFSDFQLDLESGEFYKHGLRTRLPPQAFRVLMLLASRPGRVVSREDLRAVLWSDGTFVDFEHSIASTVNRLRIVLGDTAARPRYIETLPGRGYRFVGLPGPEGRCTAASVAVLPVANLSGAAELEPLCATLTDTLVTELGKDPDLRVPSRQTVLRYRGTVKVLGAIARELRVRALLECAATRDGERVRLSTRLLRIAPEAHLWAATHDLDDSLGAQEGLAREIAHAVHEKLV